MKKRKNSKNPKICDLHCHSYYSDGEFSPKEIVRKAKKKGLKISCDVAAHQLIYDDECVKEFDTNYKVNPPFRSKKDIKALLKGLKDGTIDAIVSAHEPQDVESKNLEYDPESRTALWDEASRIGL